ncbi:MAG: hypothetical protein IKX67_00510, partial [Bacteroidales bacterium]|nr:hypothetical protein [Bacteroidales bacterium]
MKKILLLLVSLLLVCGTASAQGLLKNLGERAKNAVENNLGNKVEQGVNNVLDGVIGGKNKDKDNSSRSGRDVDDNDAAEGWTCPECGHKGNTSNFCDDCGEKKPEAHEDVGTSENANGDFQRGAVVFFDDTVEKEQVGE